MKINSVTIKVPGPKINEGFVFTKPKKLQILSGEKLSLTIDDFSCYLTKGIQVTITIRIGTEAPSFLKLQCQDDDIIINGKACGSLSNAYDKIMDTFLKFI